MSEKPLVAIILGSDSDFPAFEGAMDVLDEFGVSFEIMIASAHRSPERVLDFSSKARDNGFKVIIAGAGMAAHLAGVVASHTTLPVIGVPMDGSALQGMDALLSTVQMPAGIPVATVAIGKAGAYNAAVLATQIISLGDPELAEKLKGFKNNLKEKVAKRDQKIQDIVSKRYEGK